jgi:hypothetical protein
MRYEKARELFLHHWAYSGVDEDKAHEIYHDDAILEFPQSGERFRGKANMQGFRERYPATGVDFEPREIRGSGDFWIGEGRARYDGGEPIHFVNILEFRADLVQRETIYFAEPFPAPEWRRPHGRLRATSQPGSPVGADTVIQSQAIGSRSDLNQNRVH